MATAFDVQGVSERNSLDATGNIVPVVTIYLHTLMGATGSIELPRAQYIALTQSDDGKKVLRDMLQERADALDLPFQL